METATTAAMETATTTAMETAATAAAVTTAATVLSVGWGECETNEGCERDQRLEKTGSAHNLYLPYDVGALRRVRSLSGGWAGSYLIRF
jgi:hypothetical protein